MAGNTFMKGRFTRNVNKAAKLRVMRLRAGLTQRQIGEALDMSNQGYGYWERGVKNLTDEDVEEVRTAIGNIKG